MALLLWTHYILPPISYCLWAHAFYPFLRISIIHRRIQYYVMYVWLFRGLGGASISTRRSLLIPARLFIRAREIQKRPLSLTFAEEE